MEPAVQERFQGCEAMDLDALELLLINELETGRRENPNRFTLSCPKTLINHAHSLLPAAWADRISFKTEVVNGQLVLTIHQPPKNGQIGSWMIEGWIRRSSKIKDAHRAGALTVNIHEGAVDVCFEISIDTARIPPATKS